MLNFTDFLEESYDGPIARDEERELIREWALEAITNRGKHKQARRLRSIARNKKITRKQR